MSQTDEREEKIFEAALQLPQSERPGFLLKNCGEDVELRRRVERLLSAFERAADFIQKPAGPARTIKLNPLSFVVEKPGERLGRYKLLEQIGEGGFGVVYVAEQEEPVRRRVALKVIKLGMDTKQVIARFEAERQALALMDHPNIAKVLDAGCTETGRPYFVMELVRGIKITDYCEQHKLEPRQRLDLFILVCRAIQHAHQKGVVHRDIKPSNILVSVNDGVPVPKVIDFGIAKAIQGRLTNHTIYTAFEQFMGTPAYMSPEQALMTNLDIDTRSDIYSLGVLLYEMLTGTTPFDAHELLAQGVDAMRHVICEVDPVKPSTRLTLNRSSTSEAPNASSQKLARKFSAFTNIPSDLDWIVMKCLEKDRNRRYETANGLASDISRHLDNEPIGARPPSQLYRLQKSVQKNKLFFAAVSAVVLALTIGLAISTKMYLKARREAAKSQNVAQFLTDMLNGAGPSIALGRDTTLLREIALNTSDSIKSKLKNEPEVALEMEMVLTRVYFDLRVYDRMMESAQESRRLASQTIGVNTLLYADATGLLASAQVGLGMAVEGEASAREAIERQRKLRGADSVQEAYAIGTLADALRILHRLPEAEIHARNALAIHRKRLGNDSSQVAWALDKLNIILENQYTNQSKMIEAEAVIREAIDIRTRLSPGREQWPLAMHYERLGRTISGFGLAKRLPEAEEALRHSLAIEQSLLGEKHPALVHAHFTLAEVLEWEAKLPEAEIHFRAAADIARSTQGMANDHKAFYILHLGQFLGRIGKQEESSALINESQALSSNPKQ